MKILLAHNHYQVRGGEDIVFEAEKNLLIRKGHSVITYERTNDEFNNASFFNKALLSLSAIGSYRSYKEIKGLIRQERPDIVHFHNTFPLISSIAYRAVKETGIPVIQTLHNYRPLCVNALLLRRGQICEDCIGKKVPWPGIFHSCYRGSYSGSTTTVGMITLNRLMHIWENQVDRLIALSKFSRRKFIEGGLPSEKISVKPNFLDPDPGLRNDHADFALYVGRLSPEKGIMTLIESWKKLSHIPLKVIGEGALLVPITKMIEKEGLSSAVEVMGWLPHHQVLSILRKASVLISPSQCYENFPMAILDAFACGVPVVTSNIGTNMEIVTDHQNGLLFERNNPADLFEKIDWALNHPEFMNQYGFNGREDYLNNYSAEQNYQQLMAIYQQN